MAESASAPRHFQVLMSVAAPRLIVAASVRCGSGRLGSGHPGAAAVTSTSPAGSGLELGLLALGADPRSEASVIPLGLFWISRAAPASFETQAPRVITAAGEALKHDVRWWTWVFQLNWSQIQRGRRQCGTYGDHQQLLTRPHRRTTWERSQLQGVGNGCFQHHAPRSMRRFVPRQVMYGPMTLSATAVWA